MVSVNRLIEGLGGRCWWGKKKDKLFFNKNGSVYIYSLKDRAIGIIKGAKTQYIKIWFIDQHYFKNDEIYIEKSVCEKIAEIFDNEMFIDKNNLIVEIKDKSIN